MVQASYISLLLLLISCSQNKTILKQDYNFLVVDGEIAKLHQHADTLFELKCYVGRPCLDMYQKRFKILSSIQTGNIVIIKAERLDTIPFTRDPYPDARYRVVAFKSVDKKKLGYLVLKAGITREEMDTLHTDVTSLDDKFFYTFFSDEYLKELRNLKPISTINDANKIIETANSEIFKPLLEKYARTQNVDMYGTGIRSEILNLACIERGYNPIGAGRAIKKAMKQQ